VALQGLGVVFAVVRHYVYKLQYYDFEKVFFGSAADISYFIMCVPFVLYAIVLAESDQANAVTT
jgi:hypothetical protein